MGSTQSCNGTSGSVPRCSCPGVRWPAAPPGCSAIRRAGARKEEAMKKRQGLIIATVLATAAIARAQPQPGDPAQPGGDAGGSGAQIGSDGTPTPPVDPPITGTEIGPDPYAPNPGIPELPKRKTLPHGPIGMPEVLTTPPGWLLPAAVLYS